jgi:DNA-directed RNA polymerase specialized sigma24 family protein
MAYNIPAYAVRAEETDGTARYFAAFTDGSGTRQEAEIDRETYLALEDCRRHERRQVTFFERHVEHLELSEAQLAARALRMPLPMDEAAALAVDMRDALATLTDIQRRRFLLYHAHGLNYRQLAQTEGCSTTAAENSVTAAAAKLKKFFEG